MADEIEVKQSLIDRLVGVFKSKTPRGMVGDDIDMTPTITRVGSDLQQLFQDLFGVSRDRIAMYTEYDDMEADSPIVCSALDAAADTAVSGAEGSSRNIFDVTFEDGEENEEVIKLFSDLDERTGIRRNSWSDIRGILKDGDQFLEVVVDGSQKPMQIHSFESLPTRSMVVVPKEVRQRRGTVEPFEQWDPSTGAQIAKFQAWQVVHMATKVSRSDVYGRSMLYAARRTYKQLQMIQDSMVVGRLLRAPMRYVHVVPTHGMSAKEAQKHVEEVKRKSTQRRRYDSRSGKLILEAAPLTEETDFFVPNSGKDGASGDVKLLGSEPGSDRIADVEYFTRCLFGALRVPPSYVGWEQDTAGRAQIVTLDIAFARLVQRVQMTHGEGVRQMFDTELALRGKDPKTVKYSLEYAPVVTVDELRRWQVELLKTQIAATLKKEGIILDEEYILKHVLEIEDEVAADLIKKAEKARKKAEKEAADIAAGSGFGMDNALPPGLNPAAPEAAAGAPKAVESTSSARRRIDESLRRRGVRVALSIENAVQTVVRRPSFLHEARKVYELLNPVTVSSSSSVPAPEIRESA